MATTLPKPHTTATLSEHEKRLRKDYIGASESAALLGVNPYDNATDIFHRKVNGIVIEQTRVMQIGQLFEPLLLDYAAQELGVTVHKGRRRVHPDAPLQATPDGFVKGQRVLIEAKKVNLFAYLKDPEQWGESYTDHVPLQYLVQVQHSLEVLTASDGEAWDTAYLVVCIGDDDFRIYEITRNQAIGEKIVTEATRFMTEHVAKRVEPTDEPAHMDTYSHLDRGEEVFTGVPDRIMRLFETGKKMEKRGQALVDRAKREVLQLAGEDYEVFQTKTRGKFSYKQITQNRIDTKALKAERPDVAEQYTAPISFRQFRGYPKKGGK